MKKSNFVKGTLEECCNTYYSWAFDECMVLGGADQSSASNLDYFYVDYYSNSCKQSCLKKDGTDTKNCGGIAPKWMQTFKTSEECCINKLFWLDQGTCVADSTKNIVSEEDKGSKDWYVDWEMYKCVRDCVKGTGSNCGGLAGNWDDVSLQETYHIFDFQQNKICFIFILLSFISFFVTSEIYHIYRMLQYNASMAGQLTLCRIKS